MMISVYDLALLIIFGAFLWVCYHLVAVLKSFHTLTLQASKILADNETDLRQTMAKMPQAMTNVHILTTGLCQAFEETRETVTAIGETIEETASSITYRADSLIETGKTLIEFLGLAYDAFQSRKRK